MDFMTKMSQSPQKVDDRTVVPKTPYKSGLNYVSFWFKSNTRERIQESENQNQILDPIPFNPWIWRQIPLSFQLRKKLNKTEVWEHETKVNDEWKVS